MLAAIDANMPYTNVAVAILVHIRTDVLMCTVVMLIMIHNMMQLEVTRAEV